MNSVLDFYIQENKRQIPHEFNSAFLKNLRSHGQKDLANIEIPTRKNDDWKYTNLTNTLENKYDLQQTSPPQINLHEDDKYHHIYFSNGILHEIEDTDFPFSLIPISQAHQTDFFEKMESENYFKNDFNTIFNWAHLNQGYFFIFNKNTSIDKPIMVHHFFAGESSLQNITNFFIIEDGAKVSLIENFHSQNKLAVNLATHVHVCKNAHFEHVQVQDIQYDGLFLNNLNSYVKRDANYNNIIINTGAKTCRGNLLLDLLETGAHGACHGLYALHRNQHCDTMSYIKHTSEHTTSEQLYKGILTDESRGVFTGRVRVDRDAQQINATQLNKNLLISKKAQAYSRPQMEIYADDVKCAHGSTTGQLSEDELFYFEARGIRKDKARQILARGFAYDVVLKINSPQIQSSVKEHLLQKHIVSDQC